MLRDAVDTVKPQMKDGLVTSVAASATITVLSARATGNTGNTGNFGRGNWVACSTMSRFA